MASPAPHHHRHQVLIVDDYADICEALAMVLGMDGMEVETALSGEEALATLETGFRPCVMLLDIRMPGMNGWDLWDRMRADPELATIPVVVVSGDSPDAGRARAVGMREVLRKPVESSALIAAVTAHCEQQTH
jgi:two-component system chemotaxis response regulator CheY